jgi:hypothetical protein
MYSTPVKEEGEISRETSPLKDKVKKIIFPEGISKLNGEFNVLGWYKSLVMFLLKHSRFY